MSYDAAHQATQLACDTLALHGYSAGLPTLKYQCQLVVMFLVHLRSTVVRDLALAHFHIDHSLLQYFLQLSRSSPPTLSCYALHS